MKAARRPAAGDPLPVYTPEADLKRAESSKASHSPSAKRSKVDPALLGQRLHTVKRPAAQLVQGIVVGHMVGSFSSSSDPLAVQNLEFGKLTLQLPDDSGFENLGDAKPRPVVQGTVVADMSSFPAVQGGQLSPQLVKEVATMLRARQVLAQQRGRSLGPVAAGAKANEPFDFTVHRSRSPIIEKPPASLAATQPAKGPPLVSVHVPQTKTPQPIPNRRRARTERPQPRTRVKTAMNNALSVALNASGVGVA
jgi:hypothetical protein